MEFGIPWMGYLLSAVTVTVSGYLVWRAVQDSRKFEREDGRSGGRWSGPDGSGSGSDADGWRDGPGRRKPEPAGGNPDVGDSVPGAKGWKGDDEGWAAEEAWKPDPEAWKHDPDE